MNRGFKLMSCSKLCCDKPNEVSEAKASVDMVEIIDPSPIATAVVAGVIAVDDVRGTIGGRTLFA